MALSDMMFGFHANKGDSMLKSLFPMVLALTLSACGTTASVLKYSPAPDQLPRATVSIQPAMVGTFADEREGDKKWLGVIRGGFGNHLKTLEADRPVNAMVKSAFEDGLRARKVGLAENAPLRLSGRIAKLYADQLVRREGVAEVELVVADAQGNKRFSKTYTVNRVEGSAITLSTGVFASIDELRNVLERTLTDLVDKALDDPELRAALQI